MNATILSNFNHVFATQIKVFFALSLMLLVSLHLVYEKKTGSQRHMQKNEEINIRIYIASSSREGAS